MSSIAITGGATGTGVFSLLAPSTSTNRTLTLPDETGTLQISGGAVSGTTGTFSGIVAANGGGIQFPATQSASANANTLDDYEEGTWTPTVTANSGSITSYTSAGQYRKIGSLVVLQFQYVITNNGTGAISISITGIPFSGTISTGTCIFREIAVTGVNGTFVFNGATSIVGSTYNNSYPGGTNWNVVGTMSYQATA